MARTMAGSKKATGARKKASKSSRKREGGGKAVSSGEGKRKWKSGTVALREIRRLQKSTALLLQKAPFQRLVREVLNKYKEDAMFRKSALAAFQDAAESYAVNLFEHAVILQLHRKRKTMVHRDIFYLRYLRREIDGDGNPDW
eukprot:TRINITY_DN15231_c1_g4_i1.p2 TRINITY_DN15231_c1_g4~~TRINITY_DN15231_c1_g4_i1.p2  ORF type:complete len:143 (+),score=59.20 TRINITY_DN15231_c1_g4_i1:72-500(+)